MTAFELMQSVCSRGETGMLFALTKDGHQLRVGFANGAIVHVAYALRAGAEALLRVKPTTAVSSSFARGIPSQRDADLPDRDVLMKFFAPILSSGTVTAASERKVAPSALGRHDIAGRGETHVPNRTPIEQLRQLSLEYLGPIGGVLLDEERANDNPPWIVLVNRLANQLASPAAADSFRKAALRITE